MPTAHCKGGKTDTGGQQLAGCAAENEGRLGSGVVSENITEGGIWGKKEAGVEETTVSGACLSQGPQEEGTIRQTILILVFVTLGSVFPQNS